VFRETAVQLDRSAAYVLIAPEWGGMAPAALKNFLLLVGKQMADKPTLIVSVSSGLSGGYPICELRMSSFKNTRIVYTPDHIIVRQVESILNDSDAPANETDTFIRNRICYGMKTLHAYGNALKQVRDSGVLDYKNFPFGM
jgi:hypothetical protein